MTKIHITQPRPKPRIWLGLPSWEWACNQSKLVRLICKRFQLLFLLQPSSELCILTLLALATRWNHFIDDGIIHQGEEMLALIPIHHRNPPLFYMYDLQDLSSCSLVFFGKCLSVPSVYDVVQMVERMHNQLTGTSSNAINLCTMISNMVSFVQFFCLFLMFHSLTPI